MGFEPFKRNLLLLTYYYVYIVNVCGILSLLVLSIYNYNGHVPPRPLWTICSCDTVHFYIE